MKQPTKHITKQLEKQEEKVQKPKQMLHLPPKPLAAFRKQQQNAKQEEVVRRSKRINTLKMKQDMAKVMEVWIKTGKIGNYEKKEDSKKNSKYQQDITTTAGALSLRSVKSGTRSRYSVRV